jgi:hypothetical protein
MKVIKDGKDIAVSVCPHCKKEVQISKYDWEELKAHLIGQKEKRKANRTLWITILKNEVQKTGCVSLTASETEELIEVLEG